MDFLLDKPFRWSLARAEQLGRLLEAPDLPPLAAIDPELLPACARIMGFAGDSDLVFVGRSPENFFDLLSGLLLPTSWSERLTLLHFSMRYQDEEHIRTQFPQALPAMRAYLQSLNLHPQGIAQRARPVALVDLVSSGDTFSRLVMLWHRWCQEARFDWRAVRRRLRIVGVTARRHNSPNTWRWQQHAPWLELLGAAVVKNVSIPSRLWRELGDNQPKLTHSYRPAQWGAEVLAHPAHEPEQLAALRYAFALFKWGQARECRAQFIKLLGQQPAVKASWMRHLMHELRTAPSN